MGSCNKNKIKYLIVDTSAFINNAAIQEIGENILTVPEVVNEIKNKRQLRRLVVLPYNLAVKEAYPENIKFVNEFSKKTGDYRSLSATDINVIALTYQLEVEENGKNHLHNTPVQKPTIESSATLPDDLKKTVGFYVPKKAHRSTSETKENSEDEEDLSEFESAEEDLDSENEKDDFYDVLVNKPQNGVNHEMVENTEENHEVNKNGKDKNVEEESCESNVDVQCGDEEEEEEEDEDEEEEEEDEDEGDSEWITPDNIEYAKNKIASEVAEDLENVNVACLTTDFAMQNVLKQIGLNVVSLDGKLIKQLRTYILRCYGCFKTTSIMTKVFCPNCGNKTLKRVGVSLNADGSQRLHINFRRPLTARGKKFSLPRPKGGKHSNNPILCEDQPMPQQRPSRLSRTKNNPLNDDYIAGYSPFVTRDVTSRSAMLGIKPHLQMKQWMRRNPNESRKKKR